MYVVVSSNRGFYTGESPEGCACWDKNKSNARLFRTRELAEEIADEWGATVRPIGH